MLNNEIKDLEARIKRNIPPCLDYACRFWSDHLCESAFSPNSELLSELSDFVYTRLLFWLEALSLLGKFSLASTALLKASWWIPVRHTSIDLRPG